ncbi:Lcl C-terminal domain-containing protein [Sulfurospirillum multivorans]|uniref:Lcl C-terminal domain-containing protein n=2 Tax=Sulfurospirillum multivorans TaxID=66821 RepID=A0AA86AQ16_SULMK|nr:DUF1566 domain-containing protein [Sulfurospirillum multivorans]AHJ13571.1 hypothetical protein SMUL_2318 [Sulfurospirillum multivorans DSM 12446]QEH07061.1 hypothetical protein SMN_2296 [Sulfurospirillum multivorans]
MKKYMASFLFCAMNVMAECSLSSNALIARKGEVTDTKTGLIWSRCSLGQVWHKSKGCVGDVELLRRNEAEERVRSLGTKWRLPSIDELLTLVEPRCKSPMINAKFFGKVYNFTGEGAIYLSSSIYLEGDEVMPTLFYTIDLMNGGVDAHTKSFVGAVRLVR